MFKQTYGIDKFNLFILLLSIPFALSKFTFVISLILIVYSFYRCFSKDFVRRRKELYKFEGTLNIIKTKALKKYILVKKEFKYKIVTCPNCSQKLRIPRFKGKLVITCNRCRYQFKFKS